MRKAFSILVLLAALCGSLLYTGFSLAFADTPGQNQHVQSGEVPEGLSKRGWAIIRAQVAADLSFVQDITRGDSGGDQSDRDVSRSA